MKFNHVSGYTSPDLISKTTQFNGRFYQSPTTKLWYPSVTTVTGFAKKEFFAEWRKNPQNAKKSTANANKGTRVHSILESMLNNDNSKLEQADLFSKILIDQMQPNLLKINNICYQEISLWSDDLRMAGRVDCVAEYDGVKSIIDFKTSTSAKPEEWITNYFEQATIYSIMHKERFGEPIKQIVILITCDDGTVQEFVKKPITYVPNVVKTMTNYWSANNFEEIQKSIENAEEKNEQ